MLGLISLAEAVKLKSILNTKHGQLMSERRRVAFVSVEKGSEAKRDGRTLAQVEQELTVVRKDIRTLDRLVYAANIENTVDFQGEKLTLVEAIELAKQLRLEVMESREFAEAEKETVEYGYGDSITMVRVALFDPEHYYEQADQLERQAHKLSNAINAKNYQVHIDFDDANYM